MPTCQVLCSRTSFQHVCDDLCHLLLGQEGPAGLPASVGDRLGELSLPAAVGKEGWREVVQRSVLVLPSLPPCELNLLCRSSPRELIVPSGDAAGAQAAQRWDAEPELVWMRSWGVVSCGGQREEQQVLVGMVLAGVGCPSLCSPSARR